MSMISLVYVSFASQPMSDDELRELLEECRTKNHGRNITGMLLYRDGFFIQALEGEAEVVNALYERIGQDARHRSVLKVTSEPIEKRSFNNWAMGFNKLGDQPPEPMEGYTDFLSNPNAAFFTDQPDRAHALLKAFQERTYF
jgi:hypothetical protein